ncbi:MAG: 4Fe-4S dicluster domain-containing protein [Lachnospiraceae bacterium]|jgi:predicted aldo/keto reductase-like oxidoreductase|nr:4Fe-4S dicluster domain-containing protein [Lachnospiraceae bacterium]
MNTKKLGFGLMRLPLTDPADSTKVDYEVFCRMVDQYLERGFTYFDTAAPYHGGEHSEIAFRECVAKRFPRKSYTITDKLSFFIVQKAEELEGFFEGQLERCGVEYFDYYLLHAMNKERLELAERIGAFDFVARKKMEGKIRHVGFSFHDTKDVLEEILIRHPEMEYVQLQLNYVDWEDPEVQSGRCYEVCKRLGKPVIVMEPVKGGLLANIPDEARTILVQAAPDRSAASWAIRYAASLDNVVMVLSGMSDEAQMEDNLACMQEFQPLSQKEQEMISRVAAIIREKERIACTMCRYCVDGCPKKIAIPDYFKLMNKISKFGKEQIPAAKTSYIQQYTAGKGKASDCVKCGQCERHCPQHLPIIQYLEDVAQTLE